MPLRPAVGILLETGHASARGLDPEPLMNRLDGRLEAWIARLIHTEQKQAQQAGIQRPVYLGGPILRKRDRAHKATGLIPPEMALGAGADALGGGREPARLHMLPKRSGEARRRLEAAIDRADCPGMDPTPLLPEIVGGERQVVRLIYIARHKCSRRHDEVAIERQHLLHIAVLLVVLPERPEHQRGLVLLDRQHALSVQEPGMPTAAQAAIRVVFVQQKPPACQERPAEAEEGQAEAVMAGEVERIRA